MQQNCTHVWSNRIRLTSYAVKSCWYKKLPMKGTKAKHPNRSAGFCPSTIPDLSFCYIRSWRLGEKHARNSVNLINFIPPYRKSWTFQTKAMLDFLQEIWSWDELNQTWNKLDDRMCVCVCSVCLPALNGKHLKTPRGPCFVSPIWIKLWSSVSTQSEP